MMSMRKIQLKNLWHPTKRKSTKNMGCVPCLTASTPKKMTNWKRESTKKMVFFPCLAASTQKKTTNWKKNSPHMTSPIIKRLMKVFQVRCLIIMKKTLIMLISLVLKIFQILLW
jgi:hypothetical protein